MAFGGVSLLLVSVLDQSVRGNAVAVDTLVAILSACAVVKSGVVRISCRACGNIQEAMEGVLLLLLVGLGVGRR